MSPETYKIHKTLLEDNKSSNDCLGEWPLQHAELPISYAQSFRDTAFENDHPC